MRSTPHKRTNNHQNVLSGSISPVVFLNLKQTHSIFSRIFWKIFSAYKSNVMIKPRKIKHISQLALLLFLFLPINGFGQALTLTQRHVVNESAEPDFLLVLSGRSGSIEGNKMVLNGVPSVIYFSDRPARIAGHMTMNELFDTWYKGNDSFAIDPPNATLSLLSHGEPSHVVLELVSVAPSDDDSISFGIRVLKGTPPSGVFGAATLFIDGCQGNPAGCL